MAKITDKIAALPSDANYFSLEFFPPKTTAGWHNLEHRLTRMSRALAPLFINITWGAGGSTATKSLELAALCQRQLNLTTCLHLTCTNMNKSLIDAALDKARAIGIRNILALRGDPPREGEYFDVGEFESGGFEWAVDLVKYIRKQYGDYFCVGVAAYPEGHADSSHPEKQDIEFDLPYLVEKTKAGADFIMTQLFYDVEAYEKFEDRLRSHESGVFKNIPIVPGLMPIQSYQILRRTTKLSHARLPPDMVERLELVKGDDEAVKAVGVDILSEMITRLQSRSSPGPRGFHFYTLNLEKAVSQIVERCHLLRITEDEDDDEAIEIVDDLSLNNGTNKPRQGRVSSVHSDPHNRVIVEKIHRGSVYEALERDVGGVAERPTRATTLAISEGEGAMGREATWDDYPNGRWGDARSPAFGEIDGYGTKSLHVSTAEALKLWGHPVTPEDISDIFRKHISGDLQQTPWSEEGLSQETSAITSELLAVNKRGWWTVASQPAVNGVKSTDEVFGWGPRGGFVFQKPFVEFFLPPQAYADLKQQILERHPDTISFFATNSKGSFESSDSTAVNPVTWGTFPGKEIVTPTIIEREAFCAWGEEAWGVWREWQRCYPSRSATAKLLGDIHESYWLVNIVGHEFVDKGWLWRVLAGQED